MRTYPLGKRPSEIRKARRFGAPRDGGKRKHAGVDVPASTGQVILAPVSGYVREQSWSGPARAVVVTGATETWLIAPAKAKVHGVVPEKAEIAEVTSYSGKGGATHAHVQYYSLSLPAPLKSSQTVWRTGEEKPERLEDWHAKGPSFFYDVKEIIKKGEKGAATIVAMAIAAILGLGYLTTKRR